MKSGNSSLHDRVNITKQKVTPTRSNTGFINASKSSTSDFLKKNCTTLKRYSKIFAEKASVHIGHPDTHFKKSLRKYDVFSFDRNTTWIKVKDPHPCIRKHNFHPIEYLLEQQNASGDSTATNLNTYDALPGRKSHSDLQKETNLPRSNKSSYRTSQTQISSRYRSSSSSSETSETKSTSSSMADAQPEENVTDPEENVTDPEENATDAEQPEGAGPDPAQVEPELTQADPDHAKAEPEEAGPVADEEFKTLLDKSLQELQNAAEGLDDVGLTALTEELEEQIGEMGEYIGDSNFNMEKGREDAPSPTGDGKAIMPIDNKVLIELEQAELQARSTANIINDLKGRVAVLISKDHMTDAEAKELEEMNRQLISHMEDFEAKTKLIQVLVKFADENLNPMNANLPAIQEKQPEDMLPKVIICGTTENNMPKIIICDSDKNKKKSHSPSSKKGTTNKADVVPQFAKRLSESYEMQEKLAADNVDLEGKRFQLQEELLNRDKANDNMQRKISNLQAEMRIIAKENAALTDKLQKVQNQGKCRQRPDMPCGSGRGVCPADVENRLHHYSQTTSALEKQVEVMENEVHRMQDELATVQKERLELEKQRMAAMLQQQQQQAQQAALANSCRPTCHGACRPGVAVEQQLRELREQYNRLQDDYKSKVTEVAGLRADNENLKCTCKDMEGAKRLADTRLFDMEKEMHKYGEEKDKLIGSKEQLVEQEQQLIVAKQRFRDAQDELEETRALIGDQAAQLEDYRNKYLEAQQQVEEQRRQIDMMEMENNRVGEQVAVEIQRVKTQFQEKLAELSPLPDILKTTQLKLQEETQLRLLAERNAEALARELQLAKEKEQNAMNEMEKVRSDRTLNEDERVSMQNRVEQLVCKCGELNENCERQKAELIRAQEVSTQNAKRVDEKMHEITQLVAQLESVREESARQVARTKDRCETVRRSMQGQIAGLERQLAQARAMAKSAQKDRDEIRQRMQAQINNLNENFEEAQLRIRSLQGHVNFLKTSYTNMFGGPGMDGTNGDDGCDCGNFS